MTVPFLWEVNMQQVPLSELRRQATAVGGPAVKTITATTAASTALTAISPPLDPVGDLGKMVVATDLHAGQILVAIASDGLSATLSAVAGSSSIGETIRVVDVLGTDGATVHLYTAFAGGLDPDVLAFTEADFDTYAAIAFGDPAGPYTDPSGNGVVTYPGNAWVLSADPMVGNSILGYWVDYPFNGATVVKLWENFAAPLPMTAAGNAVLLDIPISLPAPGSANVGS
jgi:hypothetical protein